MTPEKTGSVLPSLDLIKGLIGKIQESGKVTLEVEEKYRFRFRVKTGTHVCKIMFFQTIPGHDKSGNCRHQSMPILEAELSSVLFDNYCRLKTIGRSRMTPTYCCEVIISGFGERHIDLAKNVFRSGFIADIKEFTATIPFIDQIPFHINIEECTGHLDDVHFPFF